MDLDNTLASSHTHCQASPANATTQAWQRVCLSHRTTNRPTNKQTKKNTEAITGVWQKSGFSG